MKEGQNRAGATAPRLIIAVSIVVMVAAVIGLTAALLLTRDQGQDVAADTARAAGTAGPAETVVMTVTEEGATAGSPIDGAHTLYSGILDDPAQYSFDLDREHTLTGEYEYALVETTGDDIPELLLMAAGDDYFNPVRVFSTTDGETLSAPDDLLLNAVASAGGYRARLAAAVGGDRIFQIEGQSVSPTHDARAFVLEADRLVESGEELAVGNPDLPDGLTTIDYHPVNDRGPLEELGAEPAGGADGAREPAGPAPTLADGPAPRAPDAPAAPAPTAAAAAAESGNTVTGTVRVLTAPELAQLQGYDSTPNGEGSNHIHAVLVPDAPVSFTAQQSGDRDRLTTRDALVIAVGESTPYAQNTRAFELDGRQVTLSLDPLACRFPSDTSLPLGEPRCTSFTLR